MIVNEHEELLIGQRSRRPKRSVRVMAFTAESRAALLKLSRKAYTSKWRCGWSIPPVHISGGHRRDGHRVMTRIWELMKAGHPLIEL